MSASTEGDNRDDATVHKGTAFLAERPTPSDMSRPVGTDQEKHCSRFATPVSTKSAHSGIPMHMRRPTRTARARSSSTRIPSPHDPPRREIAPGRSPFGRGERRGRLSQVDGRC